MYLSFFCSLTFESETSGISVYVPVQMCRAIQKVSACYCKGLGLSLQGSQLVIARVFSEAISILRDISWRKKRHIAGEAN